IRDRNVTGVQTCALPICAEADVGVAAASILARDAFLRWLDQASKTLGVTLPKGASPKVIETARSLKSRAGADILKEYAKVSFKKIGRASCRESGGRGGGG